MAINNITIELNTTKEYHVLIVSRKGIKKYISKNYFSKNHINCTVLIDKAKKFKSDAEALQFYDDIKDIDNEISLVKSAKLIVEHQLEQHLI